MRVPFTHRQIPFGLFVSRVANRVPFPVVVPILHGPARGSKWIVGSSEPNYWLRAYEKEKVTRLVQMLDSQTVFYDVGANVGYYSVVAASRCKSVFAFEPLASNVAFLKKHFELNRFANCVAVEAAIGDFDGTIGFAPGGTSCEGRVADSGDIRVPAITLDTFVSSNAAPNLMKIDVEGAELNVLRGARRLLAAHHPAIFLATHSEELHRQCQALLIEYGYVIEALGPDELLAVHRM